MSALPLIPVTIITGFLGAGKTTLLKRVLTEAHGQKIAVIENEFGEEAIDNEILVSDDSEQIIQMSNGCFAAPSCLVPASPAPARRTAPAPSRGAKRH